MMKPAVALIISLLSFVCTARDVQENPFMEMAGKPYAENWKQYISRVYLDLMLIAKQERGSIAPSGSCINNI